MVRVRQTWDKNDKTTTYFADFVATSENHPLLIDGSHSPWWRMDGPMVPWSFSLWSSQWSSVKSEVFVVGHHLLQLHGPLGAGGHGEWDESCCDLNYWCYWNVTGMIDGVYELGYWIIMNHPHMAATFQLHFLGDLFRWEIVSLTASASHPIPIQFHPEIPVSVSIDLT